jgi:hypothetical protein
VNLMKNKESYTHYNGSQVWAAIYSENCLHDNIVGKAKKGNNIGELLQQNTCSEETLLY